jgi:hypothetical protein
MKGEEGFLETKDIRQKTSDKRHQTKDIRITFIPN